MNKIIGSIIVFVLLLSGKPPERNTDLKVESEAIKNIEWLVGSWEGTGQLFGREATFTMKWQKALNDKFLKLDFQNGFSTSPDASRTMNATAYYKFENEVITGQWFDSRGTMLPLSGNLKDDNLVILWGDENTEQGKTTYLNVGDGIETVDYYLRDGIYHKFGDATYTKTN